MDHKLVGWARAVKSRRRWKGPGRVPPLWLFSDAIRTPDVMAAIKVLPRGLCGVVLRHDGVPGRAEMIQSVWQLCRSRGIPLTVAGGAVLPMGAGRHFRGATGKSHSGISTASAHGRRDIVLAHRTRREAVFLSPAFPTASHPGAPALSPLRWRLLARRHPSAKPPSILALGGITGGNVARLGRDLAGVGAIGALSGR